MISRDLTYLLAAELELIQPLVETLLSEELAMTSALPDLAVLEHKKYLRLEG